MQNRNRYFEKRELYRRKLREETMKRVMWTIDIDADSPREAAMAARQLQQDKESITHLFVVLDERGEKATFDFDAEEGAV